MRWGVQNDVDVLEMISTGINRSAPDLGKESALAEGRLTQLIARSAGSLKQFVDRHADTLGNNLPRRRADEGSSHGRVI